MHLWISLESKKNCGQAYDGADVMASEKACIQAIVREISPMAMFTHHYSLCFNISIATSCKVQEVRHLIGVVME